MTAVSVVDISGQAAGNFDVPEAWLERERGEQAVHDAVVAFQAAERAGTASTKTRGDVRGGGAKPWRQKGTGRARAGTRRSPLWVGGGIIFGPHPRSYAKKINKKTRALALRRAFTERLDAGEVTVVDQLKVSAPKTREVAALFKSLGLGRSVLIIADDQDRDLALACRNLPEAVLVAPAYVNAYNLLRFRRILVSRDALEALGQRLSRGEDSE